MSVFLSATAKAILEEKLAPLNTNCVDDLRGAPNRREARLESGGPPITTFHLPAILNTASQLGKGAAACVSSIRRRTVHAREIRTRNGIDLAALPRH
jgi:hypothetical protein